MSSNHRLDPVSVSHATRLLESLEPKTIIRVFRDVCSELLGPCEARVFTSGADPGQGLEFGEEEGTEPVPAPNIDDLGSLTSALPIEGGIGAGKWRAHLALQDSEGVFGTLEVAFERPLSTSEIDVLKTLGRVLGAAVRNGQTFERTRRLTFTDDLTTLYNSRFMSLYLDREIKRCRRSQSPLSLLFMDLDGFKSINDTHGHLAGSKTLVEVGGVLERTVRDADVLIRYGGDEFVILFPETPLAGGLVIAERIRRVIETTKFLESQHIEARVSASIGIAAYPESAEDVRGLISSADRAMYEAKALGKNRVVAASPLSSIESIKRP